MQEREFGSMVKEERGAGRGRIGRTLGAGVITLVAGALVPLEAQTIRVENATGADGTEISVPIELDVSGPDTVAGFSFGVCHDGAALVLQNVDLGAALAPMNGGTGPEFLDLAPVVGVGFNAGVILNFNALEVLPVASGHEVLVANYLAQQPISSTVSICAGIGSPPVPIVVSSSGGQTLSPTLVDGTVTVTPGAGSFRRGDVNADNVIDEADYDQLRSWIFSSGGAGPLGAGSGGAPQGCDLQPNESGDLNDNEVETIADLLFFREYLDCGVISIPGPSAACGNDPDDDGGGYDPENPDPDYLISAFTVSISGAVDQERDVDIVLQILSPTTVKAVALCLELGSELSPAPVPLSVAGGVSADFFDSTFDGTNLVVGAGSAQCSTPMLAGAPTFQQLGTVHLKLAPFAIFPPAQWLGEVTIDGRVRRTTIVDEAFQDHAPFTVAGTFEFARGNANNLDAQVNIADMIWILSNLFPTSTPPGLDCEDAADVNNDGLLNIADPIYGLTFLFAGGPVIPGPYPECGFDFDLDLLGCESAICP